MGATFRLSAACIDAISILSAQLGIKQKYLFDHLTEDADSLASIARETKSDVLKIQFAGSCRLLQRSANSKTREKLPLKISEHLNKEP